MLRRAIAVPEMKHVDIWTFVDALSLRIFSCPCEKDRTIAAMDSVVMSDMSMLSMLCLKSIQ